VNQKNEESIGNIKRMRDDLIQVRDAVLDPQLFHIDIWCNQAYLVPVANRPDSMSHLPSPGIDSGY
jgi:hypothetical protein